jgi:hypothetical protein
MMLMGQRDEAVVIARQGLADAESFGDEALAVSFSTRFCLSR